MIHFQMHTSHCNMTQSDILSGTQRISHLAVQLAIENGTNVDTSMFVLHTFHRQFDIRAAGSGPLPPPETAPPREAPVGAFGHLQALKTQKGIAYGNLGDEENRHLLPRRNQHRAQENCRGTSSSKQPPSEAQGRSGYLYIGWCLWMNHGVSHVVFPSCNTDTKNVRREEKASHNSELPALRNVQGYPTQGQRVSVTFRVGESS